MSRYEQILKTITQVEKENLNYIEINKDNPHNHTTYFILEKVLGRLKLTSNEIVFWGGLLNQWLASECWNEGIEFELDEEDK